jgi:hypothetical protein
MSTINPKEYAGNLLDRLISLDEQVAGAFYEMGQLLSAIEHGKLWDILGYQSFAHLIEEELSFTSGTAGKYYHTYRHFKRLGYTKVESLGLISEFSFSRVAEYVAQASTKVGKRAVSNAIDVLLANKRQVNFTVSGDDYELVSRALRKNGAHEAPETGRMLGATPAFMTIIKEAARKPALKAVS